MHDHFLQKYGNKNGTVTQPQAEDADHPVSTAAPDAPPSAATVNTTSDALVSLADKWAVKYLTLTRVRQILEAFDDDASGWISISEANAFTTNRPLDYTVLKWLAFWAAGTFLTLRRPRALTQWRRLSRRDRRLCEKD